MATIKIEGMSCNHCVTAVTSALSEIDGITDVTVDLSTGEASFVEEKPVDMDIVKKNIEKAGYKIG
jgi:copper chaperone